MFFRKYNFSKDIPFSFLSLVSLLPLFFKLSPSLSCLFSFFHSFSLLLLSLSFILYHSYFKFSYILTEIWLCPSEGYNASFHGGSIENNTSGAANLESVFESCADSRWRSCSYIDGA